jgi:AraC family transcriptional regulator, positive regulator of tynA and feaB
LRRYRQNGREAILQKGDATLIDSATPWSSDCAGDCSRLYLRVPQFVVDTQIRVDDLPFARRIPGDSGLGAVLFHLSASLFEQAEGLNVAEGLSALEAYLRVLAACIDGNRSSHAGARRVPELSSRIMRYIETHLTESTLGPVEIASALGISVRHVHRVFASRGYTVADWIRTQRLKRCGIDLSDPRLQDKSITEIAFYWGFNDSAHFSHSFKKHYLLSPRVFRSRVMSGVPLSSGISESLEMSPLSGLRAS